MRPCTNVRGVLRKFKMSKFWGIKNVHKRGSLAQRNSFLNMLYLEPIDYSESPHKIKIRSTPAWVF